LRKSLTNENTSPGERGIQSEVWNVAIGKHWTGLTEVRPGRGGDALARLV
jgi:hypothetical protein